MNEFIITFRECLEACLIVGIIYTLLEKNNLKREINQLWLAVMAAILASAGVAVGINVIKESIGNASIQSLFEGISMYVTAMLLWYVVFWLSKHVSERAAMEKKTKMAMQTAGWGIFLVVFFAILREGFETAVFLISSFSITGTFSYLGFFTGALLAILIGYLIVAQGRKINLRSVFKYTTLLLVFLSAGMIAYGTHEAEEYLVKSDQIEKSSITRVWNILEPTQSIDTGQTIYHPLHDKGSIGIFLKGFFGYNSNPNIPEVILWIVALFFGLNMWRRFYF